MIEITLEYLASQGLSRTFLQRFFSKINFTESCWIWTGYRMPKGYGQIKPSKPRPMMLAHRASWVLHFGPIPDGLNVCHDCPGGDNPSCINPAHLWLGTTEENLEDMHKKGRYHFKLTIRFGERHGLTTLKWNQVQEIRSLYELGELSQRAIADRFNVHVMCVSRIVLRKTWNYAPGTEPNLVISDHN